MIVAVLSLKQPWAELIVSGKKTIELRTWNTRHRGEFYVHASLTTDKEKCKELGLKPENLINGAVIGKCELINVQKYLTRKELLKDSSRHYAAEYKTPCYAFTLRNAKRINPIKCKGRLGFFKMNNKLFL